MGMMRSDNGPLLHPIQPLKVSGRLVAKGNRDVTLPSALARRRQGLTDTRKMPVEVGPLIKRLRERHRLTQQDLVDYARLDRSSSYISAIETGRTSPTIAELEAIAQVFRLTLVGLIQEAAEDGSDLSIRDKLQAEALFGQLSDVDRSLVVDFMLMLQERAKRK